ncbi:hypothetical protein EMCRGX_G017338 [Ephydatia muelleri]
MTLQGKGSQDHTTVPPYTPRYTQGQPGPYNCASLHSKVHTRAARTIQLCLPTLQGTHKGSQDHTTVPPYTPRYTQGQPGPYNCASLHSKVHTRAARTIQLCLPTLQGTHKGSQDHTTVPPYTPRYTQGQPGPYNCASLHSKVHTRAARTIQLCLPTLQGTHKGSQDHTTVPPYTPRYTQGHPGPYNCASLHSKVHTRAARTIQLCLPTLQGTHKGSQDHTTVPPYTPRYTQGQPGSYNCASLHSKVHTRAARTIQLCLPTLQGTHKGSQDHTTVPPYTPRYTQGQPGPYNCASLHSKVHTRAARTIQLCLPTLQGTHKGSQDHTTVPPYTPRYTQGQPGPYNCASLHSKVRTRAARTIQLCLPTLQGTHKGSQDHTTVPPYTPRYTQGQPGPYNCASLHSKVRTRAARTIQLCLPTLHSTHKGSQDHTTVPPYTPRYTQGQPGPYNCASLHSKVHTRAARTIQLCLPTLQGTHKGSQDHTTVPPYTPRYTQGQPGPYNCASLHSKVRTRAARTIQLCLPTLQGTHKGSQDHTTVPPYTPRYTQGQPGPYNCASLHSKVRTRAARTIQLCLPTLQGTHKGSQDHTTVPPYTPRYTQGQPGSYNCASLHSKVHTRAARTIQLCLPTLQGMHKGNQDHTTVPPYTPRYTQGQPGPYNCASLHSKVHTRAARTIQLCLPTLQGTHKGSQDHTTVPPYTPRYTQGQPGPYNCASLHSKVHTRAARTIQLCLPTLQGTHKGSQDHTTVPPYTPRYTQGQPGPYNCASLHSKVRTRAARTIQLCLPTLQGTHKGSQDHTTVPPYTPRYTQGQPGPYNCASLHSKVHTRAARIIQLCLPTLQGMHKGSQDHTTVPPYTPRYTQGQPGPYNCASLHSKVRTRAARIIQLCLPTLQGTHKGSQDHTTVSPYTPRYAQGQPGSYNCASLHQGSQGRKSFVLENISSHQTLYTPHSSHQTPYTRHPTLPIAHTRHSTPLP